MTREDLLREYYRILYMLQTPEKELLIGMSVSLPHYGSGIITYQDARETRVLFDGGEKSFDASVVEESFFDGRDANSEKDTLLRLQRQLKTLPSPIDLIRKLVDNWNDWDQYEDLYLNEVAPSLVDSNHWEACDAPMLKPLKEILSPKDWPNLPKYIADVHFGRVPQFVDTTILDEKRIEDEVKNESKRSALLRTAAILTKIINHEIAEENRLRTIDAIQRFFQSDYFNAESLYHNIEGTSELSVEEFHSLQVDYVQNWFITHTNSEKKCPDESQVKAIAACEKNVEVVARAGSGKTSTIVNRFRFLSEHCHVDAASILILAFNRKAAEELREIIKNLLSTYQDRTVGMPHVMTFHALAHSVVSRERSTRARIIYDDDETGSKILSETIQTIIDKRLRDITWTTKIRSVMMSCFKMDWAAIVNGGYNLSKEQQLIYRRSLPNKTLNGEYVKSYGEKAIANILFEHDIEYRYEKAYYVEDGSIYRPDFSIITPKRRHVIIEYFGLVGNPDYNEQIRWKRRYWARKENACLIEIYPSDIADDLEHLTTALLAMLKAEGVSYRELSEDEIWDKIKGRAVDSFTETVKSFIGRCRKKAWSIDELSEKISNYRCDNSVEARFLEIACSIYDEYLRKLQVDRLEDFDGLVNRASLLVQNGHTGFGQRSYRGDLSELSFIMIDEYQDFSFLFDKLLASIRNICPNARVFCVGDDWQAINAFAGSDISFFQQFTQQPNSKRYYLRKNYRSMKEIVSIGTRLMSKEEPSEIEAYQEGVGTVYLGDLSKFASTPAEREKFKADILTPAVLRLTTYALREGKKVVFLMRTNDRLPTLITSQVQNDASKTNRERFLASIHSFFSPEERKRITAFTTHKYKGEEEDVVIVLDALFSFYPLIHPTWFFQRIFGDTVEKLIEEERRLFYVAVSRAKYDLFILSIRGEESPFISELGELPKLEWDKYTSQISYSEGIRIEITNERGFGAGPTLAIKDSLKSSYGYEWSSAGKMWSHYYPTDGFDIRKILSQDWTNRADHVVLTQYSKENQVEQKYLFIRGKPTLIES